MKSLVGAFVLALGLLQFACVSEATTSGDEEQETTPAPTVDVTKNTEPASLNTYLLPTKTAKGLDLPKPPPPPPVKK